MNRIGSLDLQGAVELLLDHVVCGDPVRSRFAQQRVEQQTSRGRSLGEKCLRLGRATPVGRVVNDLRAIGVVDCHRHGLDRNTLAGGAFRPARILVDIDCEYDLPPVFHAKGLELRCRDIFEQIDVAAPVGLDHVGQLDRVGRLGEARQKEQNGERDPDADRSSWDRRPCRVASC
jgi:hypothetical protein